MKSIETAQKKAVEIMLSLQMDEQYIQDFAQKGQVHIFDYNGKVNPIEQRREVAQRKNEIEGRGNCLIFAVTHETSSIGELYDFLFVSLYEEDLNLMYSRYDGSLCLHNVYANVWNVTDEWRSDVGRILIKSRNGKIYRLV
ncbi:MAG: hypothetical protein NC132_06530 [Corallococcus sp.]|nr:hypothetical protein [Corallococcus sp.]MCM1395740.1 hypothetical protein [Corallococcus sp.]